MEPPLVRVVNLPPVIGSYSQSGSGNGRLCQALDARDPSQSAITLSFVPVRVLPSATRAIPLSGPGLGQMVDHWSLTA